MRSTSECFELWLRNISIGKNTIAINKASRNINLISILNALSISIKTDTMKSQTTIKKTCFFNTNFSRNSNHN